VVAMVTAMVVVWQQTAMGHLHGSIKGNQLQKQNNQPEVAAAVVAWRRGGSIKWKRLQEKNQLEVAAAVVAWRQR